MVCHVVGVVAQLVEHHNGIVGVVGSIPIGSTSSLFLGAAKPFYVRFQVCSSKKRDSLAFCFMEFFLVQLVSSLLSLQLVRILCYVYMVYIGFYWVNLLVTVFSVIKKF